MRYNKEKALVRGKKKDKAFVRIFGGIFVLVGIILFTVCIFIYTSGHTFKAEATPVQAVILAMRGANHESLGTPVVEYTVGGKTYTSTLNLSSSSMHPGKQITVYYRNGNPQEVRYLDDNNWIIGLLMAMAFVFAGMGLAFILVRRKHRQKIARLLATGDTVEAEITGIREDDDQSMNGRHPIIVSCRYVASDGRIYLFHSGSFWYESYEIDPQRKVRVYVDRNNPSNYYVDVDSVVG